MEVGRYTYIHVLQASSQSPLLPFRFQATNDEKIWFNVDINSFTDNSVPVTRSGNIPTEPDVDVEILEGVGKLDLVGKTGIVKSLSETSEGVQVRNSV